MFISLIIILLLTSLFAQVNGDIVKNHTKGYCVWYDQCTTGTKAKNCLYNGPAKNLTNPEGVQILNSLCPELKGQPTCCSTKQLQALDKSLQTMIQLTSRCPACWNNMRRLYCQLTCSQDQSLFIDPTQVLPFTPSHSIVLAVDYFVSPQFKQGLFDSCKDVTFPGNNEKVLSLMCGTTAERCTPDKLLAYMGNTGNGFAPFTIDFPDTLIPNLSWMNQTVFKCNKPFIDPQTNKTAPICSCQDCCACCPVQKIRLSIQSTHPSPAGYHRYSDEKWIPFGPIFHLELLNQALDLQTAITTMKVPFKSSKISLEDICNKSTDHLPFAPPVTEQCEIQSVFQYFQNNKTRLNKCLTSMGWNCSDGKEFDFRFADFHDHLLFCMRYPASPLEEMLQEPCIAAFGGAILPGDVLAGFPRPAYHNATSLEITLLVKYGPKDSEKAKVTAWVKAFQLFMKDYVNNPSHANLTIAYSTPCIPELSADFLYV